MTRRHRPSRRLGAIVLAVALTLGGCDATHPALSLGNGSVSDCYRALPAANGAIHDSKAHFVGVQRVPADKIEQRFPGSASNIDNDTQVCALAFKGSFAAGQVDGAPPTEQGPYAVVLITSHRLSLVLSFVGAKLPARFAHTLP